MRRLVLTGFAHYPVSTPRDEKPLLVVRWYEVRG
jgi:hypothetical protein